MQWRRALTVQTASGEFHKMDITLDEDDLARMLAERLPGTTPAQLTVHEVWQLLEHEALLLVLTELKLRIDTTSEEPLIKQLLTMQQSLWGKLAAKYGEAPS